MELGLYRISAPAGIRHFFQIRQKSGSGKIPPEQDSFAGFEKSIFWNVECQII